MTKLEAFKSITGFAVSVGVGAIVGNAVAFTTPVIATGLLMKGAIGLGSLVLSSMVGDKAAEYTDLKIDEIVNEVKEAMKDDEKQEVTEG